jgi:hypothetical protein
MLLPWAWRKASLSLKGINAVYGPAFRLVEVLGIALFYGAGFFDVTT